MKTATNPMITNSKALHGLYSFKASVIELTSRSELLEWAINNQCTSVEFLNEDLKKNTFRDENGILRYNQTWLLAPEENEFSMDDDSKQMKYLFQTGCLEISFPVPALSNGSNEDHSGSIITVKILSNWERLWRHLAYSESDELAEHAALLRSCIAFFMHERSLWIYWTLVLYNAGLFFWFSSTVSTTEFAFAFIIFFHRITCGMFYIALRRLYVDGRRSQQHIEQNPSVRRKGTLHTTKVKHSLHWCGALRHYYSSIFTELTSLLCYTSQNTLKRSLTANQLSREIVSSFDHLVNIALKYTTQHCEVHTDDIGVNRQSYKLAFLNISFLLPLYCLLYLCFSFMDYISLCLASAQECQNVIIYSVLRFGYLTDMIVAYLLYGSLTVGVIGLTYGTELAYHMVHCWMKRYSALRKMRPEQQEEEDGGNVSNNVPADGSHSSSSCSSRADSERKSVTKHQRMEDSSPSSSSEAQLRDLSKQLQTDAAEQYLFMVEYMRQAGAVWAPVIVWMYLYSIFLILAVIVLYLVSDGQFYGMIMVLNLLSFIGQAILFAIFPTWSLAHANSLIAPLQELFTMAVKEDFAIIGTVRIVRMYLFPYLSHIYHSYYYRCCVCILAQVVGIGGLSS